MLNYFYKNFQLLCPLVTFFCTTIAALYQYRRERLKVEQLEKEKSELIKKL